MKTRAFVLLCLLGALVGAGCDGAKSPAGPSSAAAASTVKASRDLFEGVIKLKEQRDLMLNNSEITYTITKGKIRREAVPVAPLGKLADLGTAKAGVICDVLGDKVVLYRSGLAGKFFVRMTLAEYRKQVAASVTGLTGVIYDIPGSRPLIWRHIGNQSLSAQAG